MKHLQRYFSFLESGKIDGKDHRIGAPLPKQDPQEIIQVYTNPNNKATFMRRFEYEEFAKSQELAEEDYKKLKSKLNSVFKLLGFKMISTIQKMSDCDVNYYIFTFDLDLNCVKDSYLQIITKILYPDYAPGKNVYLFKSPIEIVIRPRLMQSSVGGAKIINSTSTKECYTEILDYILIKIMIASTTIQEINSITLRSIILSYIETNKEFSNPVIVNKSVKEYFMEILSNSPHSPAIINSLSKNNKLLYKAIYNDNQDSIENSNKMGEMGF